MQKVTKTDLCTTNQPRVHAEEGDGGGRTEDRNNCYNWECRDLRTPAKPACAAMEENRPKISLP